MLQKVFTPSFARRCTGRRINHPCFKDLVVALISKEVCFGGSAINGGAQHFILFSLQEGNKASANKEAESSAPVQGQGNVPHVRDASRGTQPSLPAAMLLIKAAGGSANAQRQARLR